MHCCVIVVSLDKPMHKRSFMAGLLLLLLSTPLSAAYITDKLLAVVYESPETASEPIEVLPSGTPVEH